MMTTSEVTMESDRKLLNKRKNEIFLYEVGYEYAASINDDIDINPDLKDVKCPEPMDEWFENYNLDIIKDIKKRKRNNFYSKVMKKIAIFFGAVILSGTILTVSVEAFRLELFNFFIESSSNSDQIVLVDEVLNQALKPEVDTTYYLSYLPEGFKVISADSDLFGSTIFYEDYNDRGVTFNYFVNGDGLTINIDNEDVTEEKVFVASHDAILRNKNGYLILFWNDGQDIFLISGNVTKKEILKIGDSLRRYE